MTDLLLSNLPAKLIKEISEWATLRRTTPERAAVELLRIGLHATSPEMNESIEDLQRIVSRLDKQRQSKKAHRPVRETRAVSARTKRRIH